jgi:hypothetical protein
MAHLALVLVVEQYGFRGTIIPAVLSKYKPINP